MNQTDSWTFISQSKGQLTSSERKQNIQIVTQIVHAS